MSVFELKWTRREAPTELGPDTESLGPVSLTQFVSLPTILLEEERGEFYKVVFTFFNFAFSN